MAQTQNITGMVTDAVSKDPIVGVAVVVRGSNIGVSTGLDGSYSITAPRNSVLEFSRLGYESTSVNIGTRTLVNVMLEEASTEMDEVVVIGYGTARKSELTGAISQVGVAEIEKTPITSIDQALQGNASGVLVINTGAEPGQK